MELIEEGSPQVRELRAQCRSCSRYFLAKPRRSSMHTAGLPLLER